MRLLRWLDRVLSFNMTELRQSFITLIGVMLITSCTIFVAFAVVQLSEKAAACAHP